MSPRSPSEPCSPTGEASDAEERWQLEAHEVVLVRAANPGPLTLTGTNTWVVGRDPAWVVDPGPAMASHLERLEETIIDRGGLGGVALTHDHHDHSEAVGPLLERFPAPLAAARGSADIALRDGARAGPFEVVYTPGHAPDHFALIAAGACFSGDAVLGSGSVFVSASMGAYLRAITALSLREEST